MELGGAGLSKALCLRFAVLTDFESEVRTNLTPTTNSWLAQVHSVSQCMNTPHTKVLLVPHWLRGVSAELGRAEKSAGIE